MMNQRFDDFFTRVAHQSQPTLIDPKTKALIAIAADLANEGKSNFTSLAKSISQAASKGVSHQEIQELLLLLCVYIGFNRVAGSFGTLNKILPQHGSKKMMSVIKPKNYAQRDRLGTVSFYVLLWKRRGIDRELFYDYWRNVHGPLCARLPGQHQYWQLHLDPSRSDLWQPAPGVDYVCPEEQQFDGIAELTFPTEGDRQKFFADSNVLMADEQNLFSKAIGYNTAGGNSRTYIDRQPDGDPNGKATGIKFHILLQQADGVSRERFRQRLENLVATIAQSDLILKLRLHLFEEIDNSRPDASGVSHFEPSEQQYQAAIEIAFTNALEQSKFFASEEYAIATQNLAQYVKKFYPFPERNVYTFVYDGKMTLAGQRSSQVADLILQAGATNQLKEDIVATLSGADVTPGSEASQVRSSSLGQYLQGVQHFGVTVKDMAQSLEFYTQVLGGQVVVGESELVGDMVQNTLFQKEELEAIAKGAGLKQAGIPNLRSTKDDALDVKFISFGNVVIELIYFRPAGKPDTAQSSADILPSHIGNVNAMHLSFNVKEDIDLNQFAQMLEGECHRRGINEVVFNRTVRVNSRAERDAIDRQHNSFKFWNEGENNTVDWSDDPMEGWSLFYCKGPNGEQLEFNQVTRRVKQKFHQGVRNYNQANNTGFILPEFNSINLPTEEATAEVDSDRLYFTFNSPVNAPLATVWDIVLDKIEHTSRYNPEAKNPQILQRFEDGMIRQMGALGMTVKERIVIDESSGTITHHLLENPYFTGKIVNQVQTIDPNRQDVSYTLDWQPINTAGRETGEKIQDKLQQAVKMAVLSAKEAAEQLTTTEETMNMTKLEKLPGQNADLVKRLFSRGEAFDSEGFITFFTDNPVYQFGNFDVCYDKQSIKQSADNFFSQIDAVYHEIKMMQEIGDVVFVEMDVAYWRKDGSIVSLPCCDIFRVKGDKFSELRIFMDVNPVFDASIPVPDSASVLTGSVGQTLVPPGTMKQHYAQHPEGQQRVKDGFAPKWSIAGPQWAIADDSDSQPQTSPEQLEAVGNLAQAVIAQDWQTVKSYLTDDIYYKVGSGAPVYGTEAVVNFFQQTFKTTAVFTGHMVRKIWQEPDIITLEMDAYYEMVATGKTVTISCCDIYRLRGNKVSEWRVYADMSPWNESANGVVSRETAKMT